MGVGRIKTWNAIDGKSNRVSLEKIEGCDEFTIKFRGEEFDLPCSLIADIIEILTELNVPEDKS